MKNLFRFLVLLLLALPASAAELVTATITFTNSPADSDTITINGNVRTWKTSVATAATQIARVASAPGTNATNLYNHVVSYPATGLRPALTATNVVTLTTLPTTTVSVSFSTAYASVTYSTQTLAQLIAVRVPFSAVPDASGTNRAYQANELLTGLNAYATNWWKLGANGTVALPILTFASDPDSGIYRTAANTWHLGSDGVLNLTIGDGFTQWNGYLYGTNGTLGSMILNSPTTTNLVNYGNAISSPGSGSSSEEFGTGSTATGDSSLAVGRAAVASDIGAIAIGYAAEASGENSLAIGTSVIANSDDGMAVGNGASIGAIQATAVGNNAQATSIQGTAAGYAAISSALRSAAVGAGAVASHTNAVALGYNAQATFSGSVAIGAGSATTGASQIQLGTSSEYVNIPGNLDVDGTIETAKIGELSLQRLDITSLANGNNAGVSISTNSFVRVSSGPTAAFTINGIAGGTDGRQVTIYNSLAYNMTIANDSGVDATAANRIYTLTGSDYTTTTLGAVTLIYDSGASRWILVSTRD